jgi:hypothetical protein
VKVCTFEGCVRPHNAAGLCSGHYGQQRRGQALRPLRPRAKRGATQEPCSFPGCNRKNAGRGLCDGHRRQRERGKLLTPLRDPALMWATGRLWGGGA